MSPNLVRWGGLAAILGGVLGIVLTPILAYLWAAESEVYGYFGRAYFLVFLGCLLGLAGLYALRRGNPGPQATKGPNEENLIIGMIFVGLVTASVGSILDYWGGGSDEGFTQVQITGYGFEMIGLLMVVLGSMLLGLHYRRANVVPALVAWLLIAAGPGRAMLKDGPVLQEKVEGASGDVGISKRTLERAKRQSKIKSKKDGVNSKWRWHPPDEDRQDRQPRQDEQEGSIAEGAQFSEAS